MTELSCSIALCTYNGSEFVLQQLASIVNQNYPPYEIVVCDDCSEDNTYELLETFRESHQDIIRLHRNSRNIGRNKNFAQAIALCSGEIIVLSDQDDIFLPNKTETIARVFKDNPDCGLVFSNATVVNENLSIVSTDLFSLIWPPFNKRRKKWFKEGKALKVLVRNSPALGCCIAIRKELRDFLLPIPAEFSHDAWIMLLCSVFSRICFIEESLVMYRQHAANIAGVQKGVIKKLKRRMATTAGDYFGNVSLSLHCWEIFRARLIELASQGVHHRSISRNDASLVDTKITYLCTRMAIAHKDTSTMRRLMMITRLLINSQYFVCGRGVYSLLRDITVTALRLKERALGSDELRSY